MKRIKPEFIDVIVIEALALAVSSYCFRGVTSLCDGVMHLSKIKILLEGLEKWGSFPRWNPYWYFGVPMWAVYPPLSYYIISTLKWIFNLSNVWTVMLWTYIVFSLISVSTYFLAAELECNRFERIISCVFMLSSGNLLIYWGLGSYPNISGFALSILSLYLFLRAVRKMTVASIIFSGLAFGATVLTYLMNALILSIFLVVIAIILSIRNPELIFVVEDPLEPPRYTLVTPKVLFSTFLLALAVSSWWLFPFASSFLSAPSLERGVPRAKYSLYEQIYLMAGFFPNLNSPGIGHMIFAFASIPLIIFKKRLHYLTAPICFLVSLLFSFSPWLRIPIRPLYWWRFTLYTALFSSISCGIALNLLKEIYEDLFERKFKIKKPSNGKIYALIITIIVLVASIQLNLCSERTVFEGYDISIKPAYADFLESKINPGERVGIKGGYSFNLYLSVPQSGGGDIHSALITNEFAYTFWYHIFFKQDPRYLQYFSRNYNVRFVLGGWMKGLRSYGPGMPLEVIGFNSSLVEFLSPEVTLVLFIGEVQDYIYLFEAIAPLNPKDIILVYGGTSIDGCDLDELQLFDVIYIGRLVYRGVEELSSVAEILKKSLENGVGVIIDTGNLRYPQLKAAPYPIPVISTSIFMESHRIFRTENVTSITSNVNLTSFESSSPVSLSYADVTREGSATILFDDERPVMVVSKVESGRILWTGLRLPYLASLSRDEPDLPGSKLVLNVLRYVAPNKEPTHYRTEISFKILSFEEIEINVERGDPKGAVWVKTTLHPGWKAYVNGEIGNLEIFYAGPKMMLVFPGRGGNYTIHFIFVDTEETQMGKIVTANTLVFCLLLLLREGLLTLKKRKSISDF
ncbi:MAG TPA: hypothetical protein ENF42_01375 [Candidatus Bathyarchaeota archaeon]|nr:hypothetical protein [Candidatus Bathyarchaeota archaeon]